MNTPAFFQQLIYKIQERKGIFQTNFSPESGAICCNLYWQIESTSLGGLMPYGDYLFFYDFDKIQDTLPVLEKIHESNRGYVNKRYKIPKAFRFKVPNIITIAVQQASFDKNTIDSVQSSTRDMIGGEVHAMMLIDLSQGLIHSQTKQTSYLFRTDTAMAARITFEKTNPVNRGINLLQDICKGIL